MNYTYNDLKKYLVDKAEGSLKDYLEYYIDYFEDGGWTADFALYFLKRQYT